MCNPHEATANDIKASDIANTIILVGLTIIGAFLYLIHCVITGINNKTSSTLY